MWPIKAASLLGRGELLSEVDDLLRLTSKKDPEQPGVRAECPRKKKKEKNLLTLWHTLCSASWRLRLAPTAARI